MNKAREAVSHLCVILGLMFLVFLVLDQFNPMMNFVNHPISRWLLGGLCACSIASSLMHWRRD